MPASTATFFNHAKREASIKAEPSLHALLPPLPEGASVCSALLCFFIVCLIPRFAQVSLRGTSLVGIQRLPTVVVSTVNLRILNLRHVACI